MDQVVQNFRTKAVEVLQTPTCALEKGFVLIQNLYSAISPGTELSTIKQGKQSLLKTAQQRPDLVAQVLKNYSTFGFANTYQKIANKLDELKPLGYSSCGVVIDSKATKKNFQIGDIVACSGQNFAGHAQIVSVPERLVIPVPKGVCTIQASFVSLGAIALQGLRLSQSSMGELVVILGLGPIGLLSVAMAKASGLKVIAIDLQEKKLELAKAMGADYILNRNAPNIEELTQLWSQGHGVDSCIITANTTSSDPVNFSASIVKKRGSIIVVGAVGLDLRRDPHFYRKEIRLQVSCSYGPGRYDSNYEIEGNDYPYSFVRWTQERNMQAFIDLLANKTIDIKPLITHQFNIADAANAYETLKNDAQNALGAIFTFPEVKIQNQSDIKLASTIQQSGHIIGAIGVGNFAKGHIFPYLQKNKNSNLNFNTVVSLHGPKVKVVQEKYHVPNISTNPSDVLENPNINTAMILNTHQFHSEMSMRALEMGKVVYVEKPLVINREELEQWKEYYQECVIAQKQPRLFVGFNRRYAPAVTEIKKQLSLMHGPKIVRYRVLAGPIAPDHWIQNSSIGGGRIIGEVCHFVDLMMHLFPQEITSFSVKGMRNPNQNIELTEDLLVVMHLADETLIEILYTKYASKHMPKETLEIFHYDCAIICEDFRKLVVHKGKNTKKFSFTSKGYDQELDYFFYEFSKSQYPIQFLKEYIKVHEFLFNILESLKTNETYTHH